MGERWLDDALAALAIAAIVYAVAHPPRRTRARRLRSGTVALVRLRRRR